MVFIDNAFDITLTPQTTSMNPVLHASLLTSTRLDVEQAKRANHIYSGNGLVCQRMMCQSMTGCERVPGCPISKEDQQKVDAFCGPIGTLGMDMDGSWWNLQPANVQSSLLTATEKSTGFRPLPTAYNTTGMYK